MRPCVWRSLVVGAVLLLGAHRVSADNDPHRETRVALQKEMETWDDQILPLPPSVDRPFSPDYGPAIEEYRNNLRRVAPWPETPFVHRMGLLTFRTESGTVERLAVNVFLPPGQPKGTLLFVHGYMSHAGNFAYTFSWFVQRGWIVTTMDLPGHGVSDGPRCDIDDFATYGNAVARWTDWVKSQPWPGPHVLVAHSLGSAATFEALRRPGAWIPDDLVFCAPLLRPVWYQAATLGTALLGWIVPYVPSRFDWDHYLDGEQMPLHWVTALGRWLDRVQNQSPLNLPLTIYTGDKDTVVDASWNTQEYRRLVPGVRVFTIPGAGHLFMQDRDRREAFHKQLTADLDRLF